MYAPKCSVHTKTNQTNPITLTHKRTPTNQGSSSANQKHKAKLFYNTPLTYDENIGSKINHFQPFSYFRTFSNIFQNICNALLLGLSGRPEIYRPEEIRAGCLSIHPSSPTL